MKHWTDFPVLGFKKKNFLGQVHAKADPLGMDENPFDPHFQQLRPSWVQFIFLQLFHRSGKLGMQPNLLEILLWLYDG